MGILYVPGPHPRFSADFLTLCQNWETEPFQKAFEAFWNHVLPADLVRVGDLPRLALLWLGHRARSQCEEAPTGKLQIDAARGWQSTGLKVSPGQKLTITATGPRGAGQGNQALGERTARNQHPLLRRPPDRPPAWGSPSRGASHRRSHAALGVLRHSGPRRRSKPVSAGTLFLRVNDRGNELGDNSGQYEVQVTPQ